MPGHFTHIYTARRVADYLASGTITDWPQSPDDHTNAAGKYDPVFCGTMMRKWEKFTAVGAIGPDLFYFSQDYNSKLIGPLSDNLMLSLAIYYYFDAAKEDNWEPLLLILQDVNEEFAGILRLLIKLQKIWNDFVASWNATIGPLVDAASEILDDLTGGLISQFQVTIDELKQAIITIGEEELLTFIDIFNYFDSCVEKGWPNKSFLWSDMSHYRRTSAMCQALVEQAEALRGGEDGENRFEQFLAFSLGYMTHLGTDVIGHAFINTQVGGPYRNHPQRHHLIENHVDSWNYKNGGFNPDPVASPIPNDPWAATKDYPDLSMSALWFAVQFTPDDPFGKQRPAPLPDDPDERKKALDVDGEMPLWMAEAFVAAMIKAFNDKPHPLIYKGDSFQNTIDAGLLTDLIKKITGNELDKPIDELLNGIAPKSSLKVPTGFPLPWEIQTMYRIMISYYKFSYNGTWELQKPKKPDFIITPPASDFTNLFQPPDFSGVDSSNPVIDLCEIFIALFEWAVKELGAAAQLAGDLIKMAVSPSTYPLRLGLYELAMMIWDIVMKTHDVLAHTGFMIPHSEQRYDDGELRLPNEIDIPLITLGSSVDSTFKQALADAIDPFSNLDKDPSELGVDHPIPDPRYPLYTVIKYAIGANGKISGHDNWEYHRPWSYPDKCLFSNGTISGSFTTPTETYDPSQSDPVAPQGAFSPLRAGPYAAGTRPDHVFFRTNAPVDKQVRAAYENAKTPFETDRINNAVLGKERIPFSPLGDPVPFSAYLISKLVNDTGYSTQFNLDSDRGYGYLTWDWIRDDTKDVPEDGGMFNYNPPKSDPEAGPGWLDPSATLADVGKNPLQLEYVDPPVFPPVPPIG
jgi:Zinc dependent phospholipase C